VRLHKILLHDQHFVRLPNVPGELTVPGVVQLSTQSPTVFGDCENSHEINALARPGATC
jgi:hypothetical protein